MIEHQTHHPDTALTMITANTHELLERISDGEIDFAIVEGYFDKTQYDYLTFSTEPTLRSQESRRKVGYILPS